MGNAQYTTNTGDYLVIQLTGCMGTYIAEVTQPSPLRIKVEEEGPYANLKDGDFIIQCCDSLQLQKGTLKDTNIFLESEKRAGRTIISRLKSLGVTDGKLYEILAKD